MKLLPSKDTKIVLVAGLACVLVAAVAVALGRFAEGPVVPDTDPEPDARLVLAPSAIGQHPRLTFDAFELDAIRQKAEANHPDWQALLRYYRASKPPAELHWIRDATDAQRQGFWRLPTAALHAAVTKDRASLANAEAFLETLIAQESWDVSKEPDCGMGAANILVGVALAYDWLHDDLDADLRERVRDKLLLQARRMYYGGHLMRATDSPGLQYWQHDPQNNHRWHRLAGLTLAVLAVADPARSDDDWMLEQLKAELDYVADGLAPDGSHHEGPSYNVFGMPHLVLAMDAADRCLGTDYLDRPYFAGNVSFRLHTLTPGFTANLDFGDSSGVGHINNYLYRLTAKHQQPGLQALARRFETASPGAFQYGWFSLIWRDESLGDGDPADVPTRAHFDDLGLVTLRDSWTGDAVAFLFKCGPYGGHLLRDRRNDTGVYNNVAHDDPDAGSFQLAVGGGKYVAGDGYAKTKQTAAHATLLLDDVGQRGEGMGWTQPLPPGGPSSRITTVEFYENGGAFIGADVAPAYDGMQTFTRQVHWLPPHGVLVLDTAETAEDIEPGKLSWLLPTPGVRIDSTLGDAVALTLFPSTNDADAEASDSDLSLPQNPSPGIGLQLLSLPDTTVLLGDSPGEHRGKSLGLQRLRIDSLRRPMQVAAWLTPWPTTTPRPVLTRTETEDGVRLSGDGINTAFPWPGLDSR